MISDPTNPPIEVEAKFLGGATEFHRIVASLAQADGAAVVQRPMVHRVHVYFDDRGRLRRAHCRLRCVVAPGEWYRYDFKAEDSSGAALEVGVHSDRPLSLPEAIDALAEKVPEVDARSRLVEVRDTAKMILVLVGKHQKAVIQGPILKLEVSWDVLSSIGSGMTISEVEVELVSGGRHEFEHWMVDLARESNLERIYGSKLERFLGPSDEKPIV